MKGGTEVNKRKQTKETSAGGGEVVVVTTPLEGEVEVISVSVLSPMSVPAKEWVWGYADSQVTHCWYREESGDEQWRCSCSKVRMCSSLIINFGFFCVYKFLNFSLSVLVSGVKWCLLKNTVTTV